ncbi:hypothetical protein HID58_071272, partial [Brassica napus]
EIQRAVGLPYSSKVRNFKSTSNLRRFFTSNRLKTPLLRPGRRRQQKEVRTRRSGGDVIAESNIFSRTNEFSRHRLLGSWKRGRVKPATESSFVRTKYQVENLGEWAPSSAGANFTPHIITVNTGEDVTKRIISFSQQGSLAICVLCANGVVSSVTIRQPDSCGDTITDSLSGSFMPIDSDRTRSRTGGMTVSLASPDGRVVGGGVAGSLVAATPIQLVVGSFTAETNQHIRIQGIKTTASRRSQYQPFVHVIFSSDGHHL